MRRDANKPTGRQPRAADHEPADSPITLRVLGALLCLGIAAIHIIDQGGMPGTKEPGYVQVLYYALEAGGVLTAAALLAPRYRARWLLALSVAVGPIVGYLLSRGPGLPNYTDDVGNWGETLGVIALAVEAALLITAMTALGVSRRRVRKYRHVTES